MRALKPILVLLAMAAGKEAAMAADPSVDNVTFAQDAARGVATIRYRLTGGPAIVLIDVEQDGKSVGTIDPAAMSGDVSDVAGHVVPPGETKTVRWNMAASRPDLKGDVRVAVRAWAPDAPPDVMVLDLDDGSMRYYLSTNDVPGVGNVQNPVYKTSKMAFRRIPAGGVRWRMGSGAGRHQVALTKDYYIAVYECTQAQYHKMSPNSKCATFTTDGDMRPCDTVSYVSMRGSVSGAGWPNADPAVAHAVDGTSYLGKLRAKAGGAAFDLPTEAQWEYACRAGSYGDYYLGQYDDATAKTIARYGQNSGKIATVDKVPTDCDTTMATANVGSYLPNAFGLYDMLGNVLERCLDRYADFGTGAQTDPVGAAADDAPDSFVVRGGCWRDAYNVFSTSSRTSTKGTDIYQSRGFRVALDLPRTYAVPETEFTPGDAIDVPVRVPASVAYSAEEEIAEEASVAVDALEARSGTDAASNVLDSLCTYPAGSVIIIR